MASIVTDCYCIEKIKTKSLWLTAFLPDASLHRCSTYGCVHVEREQYRMQLCCIVDQILYQQFLQLCK